MSQRLERLADQIQRTLSVLIRDEINDPRLTGMVTISSVKVSSDLGYADVYVTILEPSQDGGMNKEAHQESLKVLKNAAGFLRNGLSATLSTRITPRLRFHYDELTAHGNHMMALVGQAMAKTIDNQKHHQDDSTAQDDDNV